MAFLQHLVTLADFLKVGNVARSIGQLSVDQDPQEAKTKMILSWSSMNILAFLETTASTAQMSNVNDFYDVCFLRS